MVQLGLYTQPNKDKSNTEWTVSDSSLSVQCTWNKKRLFHTVLIYKVLFKPQIIADRWILPFQCSEPTVKNYTA